MNWQEAIKEIHSAEFDANLNVVSSTNGFFEAVALEEAVLEAYSCMRDSGELREETLGLVFDLSKRETAPRYENPNDTPLAVLLWLTNFAAHDFVEIAASWVNQAPRCWHAKELAQRILNPPPSSTGNPDSWGDMRRSRTFGSNAGYNKFMWPDAGAGFPKLYGGNFKMDSSTRATMWGPGAEHTSARRAGTL